MALASYSEPYNKFYKLLKEEVIKFYEDGSFELNLRYFKGFTRSTQFVHRKAGRNIWNGQEKMKNCKNIISR